MTTTVTTHSTSVHASVIGSLATVSQSSAVDRGGMLPRASMSLPTSPVTVSSMSSLLNSRNLVQDEKLVVATLATLDSGNPSNLIKQDLKWIIQSRRKAEGKAELQVEFKKPVKDELTSEELLKRARRRELNRLAARRSREKGQKRKDKLVEEIRSLQSENSSLLSVLGNLTEQRDNIIETLRQHMKQCSDYQATQSAAAGLSQRVLEMLGFPSLAAAQNEVPGVSSLCISSGESSTPPQSQSPPLVVKEESYPFSSCPSSPLIVGISGKALRMEDTSNFSPSVFTPNSPVASFSQTPSSPPVILPIDSIPQPSRLPILKRRSSTQGLDTSSTTASATSGKPALEDDTIHYKHKLMKHRENSVDFLKPQSSSTGTTRVSLERSFSFPCTTEETRTCMGPASPSLYSETRLQASNSFHEDFTESSRQATSDSESLDSPLDLVVHRTSSSSVDVSEKHSSASADVTWSLAGTKSGLFTRSLERRWSVDDQRPLCEPISQPLNLSSQNLLDQREITLSQASSSSSCSSSSPSTRTSSKFSSFDVDSYS